MDRTGVSYDPKKYPICCPTTGERGEEGERFRDDFLLGAQTIEIGNGANLYTLDQIFLGLDQGGGAAGAAPMPGGGGAAAAQRNRDHRLRVAGGHLAKYILGENLRKQLMTEAGTDGRAMWLAYLRECVVPPVDEQTSATHKAEIAMSTILETVGYREGSVNMFKLRLEAINAKMSPADRVSEHDLCIRVLSAICAFACCFAIKGGQSHQRASQALGNEGVATHATRDAHCSYPGRLAPRPFEQGARVGRAARGVCTRSSSRSERCAQLPVCRCCHGRHQWLLMRTTAGHGHPRALRACPQRHLPGRPWP